jgi:hypothetical protein
MKQIVIMPGGFHPFHAGHAALYQSAVKAFPNAEVYVAATNDTKTRPFPFAIKEKLAKLAGVADGHFIQVKSPFKSEEITSHYNPNEDVLIFVRSEKDKTEQPKPGGTKKDGSPAYFQPWTGKNLQPFSKHAYIAYLPTVEFGPGIKSATEIRNAWPNLDDRRKTAMVMSLYPVTQKNPKLAANVVKMLDMGMGGQEGVAEQAVTETAEELQELTQFSKGMANFLAKSYAQYIKNPQTAKYVQQQISQPITDGAPYRALMPAIGIVSVPGADTYTSPGLELAKKFVNMVVAYFPAPGDADYNGFSEAAPAVYDARPRTVVINKDYLSDPTDLASTIAHEVQHSIDDLKSRKGLSVKTDQQDLELSYYDQGKAFKQKQSAGATNNAQKYQSYLSMPHEVNARFTEVINDIKQRIEKEDIQNIGSAGLSELARSAFNQHYMHEVFPNGAKDPGYKRLLSRVYAWLSKYYNDRIDRNGSFNPQPATPVLEEQGVAEGAPIVVAQAPIDVRNPKKAPQPYRNQGDIVPPTKPPSTEKRGVKGRPGQRPMPTYESANLSVEQLAHISDKALDDAYHYGRSTPGANFGWMANLQSAKAAKKLIDAGETDIETISDAIHKGWNITAAADYKGQLQLDTPTPEDKKLKRAKLAMQSYSQLPEEEKEKDRVVARAMLAALGKTNVSESADYLEEK